MAVAQQARSVSGIELTNRADILVVTGAQRGAGANFTAFGVQNRPIQEQAELYHGIGLIQFLSGEKARGFDPESLLRSHSDATRGFVLTCNIEQAEDDPARADAKEVVEIAPYPLPVIDRRKLGILQLRYFCVNRLQRRRGASGAFEEGWHGCLSSGKLPQKLVRAKNDFQFPYGPRVRLVAISAGQVLADFRFQLAVV